MGSGQVGGLAPENALDALLDELQTFAKPPMGNEVFIHELRRLLLSLASYHKKQSTNVINIKLITADAL